MSQNETNIIYGIYAVEELVNKNRQSIDKIYFNDKNKTGKLFELLKTVKKEKISYACIPENKLGKMSNNFPHQGVVAFRTIRPYDDEKKLWEIIENVQNPLFILPAAIEDPGNLGAVIRSACAFGVSAILFERKGVVPLNGTVAKTSAGTIENAVLIKPDNLESLVKKMKECGIQIIGADGRGETSPSEVNFKNPVLIITGGEHDGIPAYLSKLCDKIIAIPMVKEVESLNVSVAMGILLYEAARQRQFKRLLFSR
ncbi:MAG: 23S rRNA (guanosine(2251)-2'-O)-methyltransferase RlmB [Chitinispirillales bacterium]|jgi:23S rRNA (guanosine2251-2'-O)-methyltransferase|nr:23S rRNA (guanosine(2251)-2'-O)-methyltransferase RlmB [Chitinispirillales bacterium]